MFGQGTHGLRGFLSPVFGKVKTTAGTNPRFMPVGVDIATRRIFALSPSSWCGQAQILQKGDPCLNSYTKPCFTRGRDRWFSSESTCKQNDQSSESQLPNKCQVSSSPVIPAMEGRAGLPRTSSLASDHGIWLKTYLKNKMESNWGKVLTSTFGSHIHMHACTHTWMLEHTFKAG